MLGLRNCWDDDCSITILLLHTVLIISVDFIQLSEFLYTIRFLEIWLVRTFLIMICLAIQTYLTHASRIKVIFNWLPSHDGFCSSIPQSISQLQVGSLLYQGITYKIGNFWKQLKLYWMLGSCSRWGTTSNETRTEWSLTKIFRFTMWTTTDEV